MRILRLLPDRGRSLEADEEQDAEQDAAEHPAARDAEERRLPGLNIVSVFPSLPPLAMITIARITIGMNETSAKVSIARIAIRIPK